MKMLLSFAGLRSDRKLWNSYDEMNQVILSKLDDSVVLRNRSEA